jgi:glycosyltransferase involved in cell wall biosynthesis
MEHLTGLKSIVEPRKSVLFTEYTITGDGPLRNQMEQFIPKSGLVGKVKLLGAKTQNGLREAMLNVAGFLFPSQKTSMATRRARVLWFRRCRRVAYQLL